MAPSDGNDVGELLHKHPTDYYPPIGDDYELHLAMTGAHNKAGYGYPYDTVPDNNNDNRFYVHSWWDNQPELGCEDCRCAGCCNWTTTGSATNLYTGMELQTPGGVLSFEDWYPDSSTTDDRDYNVSFSASLGYIIGFGISLSTGSGDDVTHHANDKLTYDIGLVNNNHPEPTSKDKGIGFETDLKGDDADYSEETVDVEVYSQFDYRIGCESYRYASTDQVRDTVTLNLG